jgi:hypothetical protein
MAYPYTKTGNFHKNPARASTNMNWRIFEASLSPGHVPIYSILPAPCGSLFEKANEPEMEIERAANHKC